MRKVLLAVIATFVMLGFIMTSFIGGFAVGRVTGTSRSALLSPPLRPERMGEARPLEPEPRSETSPSEDATVIPNQTDSPEEFDYQILEEVLALLYEEFYGEIPDHKTLAYGAIRGLLFTLDDPYTSFMEPQVASILNEDASGKFEGIGATVRMREDGFLEIVRPLPDHPAEAAGLEAGDLILSVDDRSIVGMGLYEAIGLIRGPAGTEVELEVARPDEDETFFVTVTRASIEMPIVESEMLDDGIAYIRLTEFDANARNAVEEVLEAQLDEDPRALIFDLRDNPGGWLDQAIKIGDLFLDRGIVAIKRDSDGNEDRYGTFDGDMGEDIPMVVLINGGSASASEIVAGAFQDRDRAILIGETTLGKGSVQHPHNLSDGSRLNVTTAHWYTPDNHSIHEAGLEPDIEVQVSEDTPADEDPQLERAIEYVLEHYE
jgi:carboxyl-terminal processing protease